MSVFVEPPIEKSLSPNGRICKLRLSFTDSGDESYYVSKCTFVSKINNEYEMKQ